MSGYKYMTISSRHATSVSNVFVETVTSYRSLTHDILQLIEDIPSSSAEEIALACNNIKKKKEELQQRDEQIVDILNIAGYELSHNDLVYDYRTALAHASNATNELYQSLLTKKLDIQIDSLKAILQ